MTDEKNEEEFLIATCKLGNEILDFVSKKRSIYSDVIILSAMKGTTMSLFLGCGYSCETIRELLDSSYEKYCQEFEKKQKG
jgi:hypothetical protein